MPSKFSYVHEIDWDKMRPLRGGVIVYTILPTNENLFVLGIDREYGEITDFGGGIRYKDDQNALLGSLREFEEESLSIFNIPCQDDINKSLVIYSNKMMIIFIRIDFNPIEKLNLFHERVKTLENSEVSDLILINSTEFKQAIKDGFINDKVLYFRVHKLLRKNQQALDLLK